MTKQLPTVYAWSSGKLGGDEQWFALADDGELMASHISSGREWGQLDVHLHFEGRRAKYAEKFGGTGEEFYRFVVLPEGRQPPPEVMEANRRWAETQEVEQGGDDA
jgi:hypothetical protein